MVLKSSGKIIAYKYSDQQKTFNDTQIAKNIQFSVNKQLNGLPIFCTCCWPVPNGSARVRVGILSLYSAPVEPVDNL